MDSDQLSTHIKTLDAELEAIYRRNDELRLLAAREPARAKEAVREARKLFSRIDEIQEEHDAVQALLERQTAPTN